MSLTSAPYAKPNRRPLIIGLALAIVGVVVLLVVQLGGDEQPAEPGGPARIRESAPAAASSIAELEINAPSGAELWLDGRRVDFEQGKPVPVTAGHRTVRVVAPNGACEKQLDLAGGQRVPFTCTPEPKEVPAPAASPAAEPPAAPPPPAPAPSTTDTPTEAKTTPPPTTQPSTTPTTAKRKPAAGTTTGNKAKPDCQPAGQYNEFDPRPICK